jgi:heme/copper-type cytochrome/quinol oxidase subunit 4
MNDQAKQNDLRLGAVVMLVLVAVNVIEYWFALVIKAQSVLFVAMVLLAFVDTGLILIFFMHILRLSEPGEGGSHS